MSDPAQDLREMGEATGQLIGCLIVLGIKAAVLVGVILLALHLAKTWGIL